MSMIEIDDKLGDWLGRTIFSQFEDAGIRVTVGAKMMITYVVQSQEAEGAPPHIRQAYRQLADRSETGGGAEDTFFSNAFAVYQNLYPSFPAAVLNVNRAIRLLNQLYVTALGSFPCGPTGPKGGQGGGSGQGGSSSQGGGSSAQGGDERGRSRSFAHPAGEGVSPGVAYREMEDLEA